MNILPTLTHKLAIRFPPFRTIVAKHLCDDPNITPQSMNGSLFLNFIDCGVMFGRSEEHTSELQSLTNLVCRLLLEKKKKKESIMLRHGKSISIYQYAAVDLYIRMNAIY